MKALFTVSTVCAALLAGCSSLAPTTATMASAGAQAPSCHAVTEQEVAALFARWNASLQTGYRRPLDPAADGVEQAAPECRGEERLLPPLPG